MVFCEKRRGAAVIHHRQKEKERSGFAGIVGESPAMQEILKTMERLLTPMQPFW
jgi:DNA-binding NtrC family response regulator